VRLRSAGRGRRVGLLLIECIFGYPAMGQEAKKVHIVTFGCQMNKLDSELLAAKLMAAGYKMTERADEADIVLYNTCSVRAHAEDRVFSHLGSYRQRASRDDGFVVGVLGCMAQRLGEQILDRFDFVRLVCGTGEFLNVPEHLERSVREGRAVVALDGRQPAGCRRDVKVRPERHRAFVSIMRGCDRFCSYCIVPYVRGREVSRAPLQIVEEVKRLCDDGVREVTLLGQNVTGYGKGLSGRDASLAALLELLDSVPGLERVRFITAHPADLTEELFCAVAGLPKVCEHIHMPAQSGSNSVLKRMNRGYSSERYRELVARARDVVPGVQIASDFIVGFPGESEDDFIQTLAMVQEVGFQQSFIFKYSPRPGTKAAQWTDDVPERDKRDRHRRLLAAQQQVDTRRRKAMVGARVEVMVDGASKTDRSKVSGRTRQNDIVVFDGTEELHGRLCVVEIVDATALTLFGRRLT